MKNIKTRDLIYCALFAALTAIGAFLHFQLFQRQQCDVLSLFQRIQSLIVKPILQQIILRNTFFLQRFP